MPNHHRDIDVDPQRDPEPDFPTLLRWHLARGTRPRRRRQWPMKEFAMELGVAESSLSRWLQGKTAPYNTIGIKSVLFGSSSEHMAFAKELDIAHARFRNRKNNGSSVVSQSRNEIIASLQHYIVQTHLAEKFYLISCAINVNYFHNQMIEISQLASLTADNQSYSLASGLDDFLDFIVADYADQAPDIRIRLDNAIEHNFSIVYRGSLHSADLAKLSKLPALIKAMASLSPKQFRVGIFRLGICVVFISVASGGGAYVGWELSKNVREFAAGFINHLIPSTQDTLHKF